MLTCTLSGIPVCRRDGTARLYRWQATLDLDSKVSHFSVIVHHAPTQANGRFPDLWMAWWVSFPTFFALLVNGSFTNRYTVRLSICQLRFFFVRLYLLWLAWTDKDK